LAGFRSADVPNFRASQDGCYKTCFAKIRLS
jgi:hypothetical protein